MQKSPNVDTAAEHGVTLEEVHLSASQRLCPPFSTIQELVTNSVERFADREALGTKKVRLFRGAMTPSALTSPCATANYRGRAPFEDECLREQENATGLPELDFHKIILRVPQVQFFCFVRTFGG